MADFKRDMNSVNIISDHFHRLVHMVEIASIMRQEVKDDE